MSKTLPSYTSGTAEVPLLGMTIGAMLDRTAEKYPDTEALVALHQDIHWTYKEFVEKVNEAARAFMAIGVKRGDRVGIWSPNRYEWTVTQFATASLPFRAATWRGMAPSIPAIPTGALAGLCGREPGTYDEPTLQARFGTAPVALPPSGSRPVPLSHLLGEGGVSLPRHPKSRPSWLREGLGAGLRPRFLASGRVIWGGEGGPSQPSNLVRRGAWGGSF